MKRLNNKDVMPKDVKHLIRAHLLHSEVKAIAKKCCYSYVSVSNFLSDKVKRSPVIEQAVLDVAINSITNQINNINNCINEKIEDKKRLTSILMMITNSK